VITLVDTDGIVSYQSAAAGTVFGLQPTALIGRQVSTWAHPDDAAALRDVLGTAAADGVRGHRVECRLRHSDGSYRFAESVVTNLLDEPTVTALVINTRDITDRKLAADQLRLVEERERIARDLHDVVVQRLFAIGLGLDTLAERLPDDPSTQVRTATDELHQTIRDIRGAILTLHSDEPDQPLRERLRIVIDRAEFALGFAPTIALDPAIDAAPEELHWHLLATAREGLSNAAKHSGATAVEVTVSVVGKELVVVVSDNGRGLPAERNESGLANLRRRAQIAGGSMTAEPGPDGRGLVLTWRAPLPRAGRHAAAGR
jgi:PAS domain S-box-containing protein